MDIVMQIEMWIQMKQFLVQILEVVASTYMMTLKTEVEEGSM